jgi:hypothetical protein
VHEAKVTFGLTRMRLLSAQCFALFLADAAAPRSEVTGSRSKVVRSNPGDLNNPLEVRPMSSSLQLDDVFLKPQTWSREAYGDRCFLYDVFISHANGDESEELAEALRRHGLRVWYDKYQNFEDIRWSTRIVWGLRATRSVICFVGSKSLEEHSWVRTEICASLTVGEAAGLQRVFLALMATDLLVPTWLADVPVVLRYKPGMLSDNVVQPIAKQLRSLNRVTIETSSPPLDSLMKRAHTIRSARQRNRPKADKGAATLEALKECVALAFEIVAKATSPEQVDAGLITRALYNVRLASDVLRSRPGSSVSDTDEAAVRILANDLGLLASLPLTSNDTRGFAYVALERLADVGVVRACEVLRFCLRWEWSQDLVRLTANMLARHPAYFQRDEAVLVILKSEIYNDSLAVNLLEKTGDNVVLLRRYARRLTAQEISKLALPKRTVELTRQMALAVHHSNPTEVELVIRDAIPLSGITRAWSNYISIDPNASSEVSAILSALVLQCALSWQRVPEHLVRLWFLQFETLVIGPLQALDYVFGSRCRASEAMSAYIYDLEVPIIEHEGLLSCAPEAARRHPTVQLALGELGIRRRTIAALRKGPTIKRNGDELDVRIYGEDVSIAFDEWNETRNWLEVCEDSFDTNAENKWSEEDERVLNIGRRVFAFWRDVPSC